MDIDLLRGKFGRMGARLRLTDVAERDRRGAGIDIGADNLGEYFDIRVSAGEGIDYEVVDLRPGMRHLLLLARREKGQKEKYLCGHDERHWFVCAVPGRGVASVVAALEALQPPEVRAAAERTLRRPKDRLRRHNQAFVRQGEWFFIPAADLIVDEAIVHHDEPISRGRGSKPHRCQFLYRHGGEAVMVCRLHPSGVTIEQYNEIVRAQPEAARWNWNWMRRNAAVYARGRVSHPDHMTIVLPGWHRVVMNTEHEAPASRNVVFLD
ncbi:MAG TPA: hypothetical protein VFU22_04250 [Roseiflexaceae bacterium]|nr:hypothetical protein [Roseiflexaceae bacterium]